MLNAQNRPPTYAEVASSSDEEFSSPSDEKQPSEALEKKKRRITCSLGGEVHEEDSEPEQSEPESDDEQARQEKAVQLRAMKYRDLQLLAKEHRVKANGKKQELIQCLMNTLPDDHFRRVSEQSEESEPEEEEEEDPALRKKLNDALRTGHLSDSDSDSESPGHLSDSDSDSPGPGYDLPLSRITKWDNLLHNLPPYDEASPQVFEDRVFKEFEKMFNDFSENLVESRAEFVRLSLYKSRCNSKNDPETYEILQDLQIDSLTSESDNLGAFLSSKGFLKNLMNNLERPIPSWKSLRNRFDIVEINPLGDKTFLLIVDTDSKVAKLKANLKDIFGISDESFYLTFQGKLLKEDLTLLDYNITGGSSIRMIGRLPGGSRDVNMTYKDYEIPCNKNAVAKMMTHLHSPLKQGEIGKNEKEQSNAQTIKYLSVMSEIEHSNQSNHILAKYGIFPVQQVGDCFYLELSTVSRFRIVRCNSGAVKMSFEEGVSERFITHGNPHPLDIYYNSKKFRWKPIFGNIAPFVRIIYSFRRTFIVWAGNSTSFYFLSDNIPKTHKNVISGYLGAYKTGHSDYPIVYQ